MTLKSLVVSTLLVALLCFAAPADALACPPDSVPVGTLCVDKYEASIWSVPDPTGSNARLVGRIKKGRATLKQLQEARAVQLGCERVPFSHAPFPASFPVNGNWSPDSPPNVYAVSVPGVMPTSCLSWFQASQACRFSEKRLISNAEWQDAAAGTPDPGAADDELTDCNVYTTGTPFILEPTETGSRSQCVSSWGAFDMVGNLWEWTADWSMRARACGGWGPFSDDDMCMTGASTTENIPPAAMLRGGAYNSGDRAGVFALNAGTGLPEAIDVVGARCAR